MIRFEEDAFYDEDTLRLLGLDGRTLAEARRDGLLPCRQLGGRRLYKGAWLQAWLSSPDSGGEKPPRTGTDGD